MLLAVELLFGGIFSAESIQAQMNVWQTNVTKNELGVCLMKPFVTERIRPGIKTSSVSGMVFGRFGSSKLRSVFAIPFYTVDFNSYIRIPEPGLLGPHTGSRKSIIGNPYLGIQHSIKRTSSFGELGVWIPVSSFDEANDAAAAYGQMSHPLYIEPVFSGVWSVSGAINNIHGGEKPISAKTRFGFSVVKPEKHTDLFGEYAGMVFIEKKSYCAGVGLSGRILLNQPNSAGLWDRTLHEFALWYELILSNIRPGVRIRAPLDSETQESVSVIGDFYFSRSL